MVRMKLRKARRVTRSCGAHTRTTVLAVGPQGLPSVNGDHGRVSTMCFWHEACVLTTLSKQESGCQGVLGR